MSIRTVTTTRYITPLREGGSLPAIVEADDGFLYVLKFRGAGQGIKALIAELIGGEIARSIGFKVPEIVFAYVDPAFGRTEPDEEIQDLLKFSAGLNLALHYLSGAITFDPAVNALDELTASKIMWLDAFLMNVDRTAKNTNMLMWQKELWLIDHGASLYFHHAGTDALEASTNQFKLVRNHVLLPWAGRLADAEREIKSTLTNEILRSVVQKIPQEWLNDTSTSQEMYYTFLSNRLQHTDLFLNEAKHAKETLV